MRLYTFTNCMLSPVQQGIQPAHVISELFIKYLNELHDVHSSDHVLYDWAKNHKTLISLSGGNNQGLLFVETQLTKFGDVLNLPFASFREDEQSLGGILTCCGIVVPARIYEAAAKLRDDCSLSAWDLQILHIELEFAEFLNQYSLAR